MTKGHRFKFLLFSLGTMVFLNISNQNIFFYFSKLWQPPSHWLWDTKSMVKTTPHMLHWLLHLGSAFCSYFLLLSWLVVLGGMHFTDQDIPRLIIWWMDSEKSSLAVLFQRAIFFISNRTFLACFGSTSDKHGKAMTRPKKPDILPNYSKKVMIRCYCTQIQPNDQDIVVISGAVYWYYRISGL